MSNDVIIDFLYKDRKDYLGLKEINRLLNEDLTFKNTIIKGISENKIHGFPEDLWEKIYNQNIRGINNFTDVFSNGFNIDRCTKAAKQLSYSFDRCLVAGGTLKCLIDSPFAKEKDGRHTWVIYNNQIYDTTLMLTICETFGKELGYVTENYYDPNIDKIYLATKFYTNDKSLRKAK